MAESTQYLTNKQGERIGVFLDLETYHKLINQSVVDSELLSNLSLDELQALADIKLSINTQTELNDLLKQSTENQLSTDESATLNDLLTKVDQLNILKTRARYTLNQLQGSSRVA
ncbi:hypothetical protein [Calothrix sp. CCY 0018]|uniref:hypothetical protein n=1 Tax=Calothrix sp. CCY 0018 TaxID=3103864 RepID=UPI0039C6EB34